MTRAGTFVRRNFEPLVLSLQVLADLVTVVAACLVAWWLREQFVGTAGSVTPLENYRGIFSITAAVCLICFHRFGMYSPIKSLLNVEEFKGVTKASVAAFFVVLTLLVLLRGTDIQGQGAVWNVVRDLHMRVALDGNPDSYSRITLVLAFALVLVFTLVARFLSFRLIQNLHRRGIGNRNVLVIGTGATAQSLQRKFLLVPTLGLNFVGFVDEDADKVGTMIERSRVLGSIAELPLLLGTHKVSEVFVALPEESEAKVMELVARLEELGLTYYVVPRFYHLMRYNVRIENLDSIPLIARTQRVESLSQSLVKRGFDLLVSATVLLLTSPFLLVSSWLIKRDSPGPVFFRQVRIGKDGRPFTMLKFRTMHQKECRDARAPENEYDPRVTRIGRILRRYSLDELPNFINVLRGEMSVVGPRPEMPFIVEEYNADHRQRLRAKPGVTGLWQISYARQTAIHDNLDYDLYYIENQSFLLDLVIVALTGFAVAKGTGAY